MKKINNHRNRNGKPSPKLLTVNSNPLKVYLNLDESGLI